LQINTYKKCSNNDCTNQKERYFHNGKFKQFKKYCKEHNKKRVTKVKRVRESGNTSNDLYSTWTGMLQRCFDKKSKNYKNYGGRGISVCDEWVKSFSKFYEDMGPKPQGFSLDRINNDKGYSKSNCKWSSRKEQARNNRLNVLITYNGETNCIKYFCEKYGINQFTAYTRYKKGVAIANLFNKKRTYSKCLIS